MQRHKFTYSIFYLIFVIMFIWHWRTFNTGSVLPRLSRDLKCQAPFFPSSCIESPCAFSWIWLFDQWKSNGHSSRTIKIVVLIWKYNRCSNHFFDRLVMPLQMNIHFLQCLTLYTYYVTFKKWNGNWIDETNLILL